MNESLTSSYIMVNVHILSMRNASIKTTLGLVVNILNLIISSDNDILYWFLEFLNKCLWLWFHVNLEFLFIASQLCHVSWNYSESFYK